MVVILWALSAMICVQAGPPSVNWTAQFDELMKNSRTAEATALVEKIAKMSAPSALSPDARYELEWRRSRLALIDGEGQSKPEAQLEAFERALKSAEAAIEAKPDQPMGYLRRAAARGKIALHRGVLESRDLANGIRQDTETVLRMTEKDPRSYPRAFALYLLGRSHAKLSETPKPIRMPLQLAWGNLADAERHLNEAASIAPDSVAFGLERAKLWLRLKKTQEAKAELQRVLQLPDADPLDGARKREAQGLL